MLPAQFATEAILAVLKKRGLLHEDCSDPQFFLACARQFVRLAHSMSRDDKTRHSITLVSMLQRNISSYQTLASSPAWSSWAAVKSYLADCPIFLTAELTFPYDMTTVPQLVSLKDSEDHANYRIVANAAPITSNAMGDTNLLRAKLGLPTEPQLRHVANHLLRTVNADRVAALFAMPKSRANTLLDFLLEDIERAYGHIVKRVEGFFVAGKSNDHVFAWLSQRLEHDPWVLVREGKFVVPRELCFDIAEDSSKGMLGFTFPVQIRLCSIYCSSA